MKTQIGESNTITEVPQNAVALSLAQDAAATLAMMESLISLYSKGEEAILRELTSNARDGSRKAGWVRPIEVTLPTMTSPLIVEDWGIGMSEAQIIEIYTKLGASTKRDDNDSIGSFGFGAKAPLMLTDRFDFRSRKDGVEIIGHCEKGKGGYFYFIDSTAPTMEPNGFRVEVPNLRPDAFNLTELLDTFFIGYPKGAILINGKAPIRSLDDATQFTPLTEGGYTVGWVSTDTVEATYRYGRSYYTGKVFGIVEDVVYQIAENSSRAYESAHRVFRDYGRVVYLNVPNGSVKMTPSREALVYNERTDATILRVLGKVKGIMERQVQNRLNVAQTRREALALYADERKGKFWGEGVTYRGESFPKQIQFEEGNRIWRLKQERTNGGFKNKLDAPTNLDLLGLVDTKPLIVTAERGGAGVDSLRRRYNAYRAAVGEANAPQAVLFTPFGMKVENAWLGAAAGSVITESEFVRVAKGEQDAKRAAAKARPKPANEWAVLEADERFRFRSEARLRDLVDAGAKVLYITREQRIGAGMLSGGVKAESRLYLGTDVQAVLKAVGHKSGKVVVVGVSVASKVNAFHKAFPEAVSLTDEAMHQAGEVAKRRDATGHAWLLRAALLETQPLRYNSYAHVKFAEQIDLAALTNPAHRRLFEALRSASESGMTTEENQLLAWARITTGTEAQIKAEAEEIAQIATTMPLFPTDRHTLTKEGIYPHIVNYLNSIQ